jgi:hypothetical protein
MYLPTDLPDWSRPYEVRRLAMHIPLMAFGAILGRSASWWCTARLRSIPPKKWDEYRKKLDDFFADCQEPPSSL